MISTDSFVRLVNGFDAIIQSHRLESRLVFDRCKDWTVQMTESDFSVLDFDPKQNVQRNLGHRHFHFFRENFRFDRDYIAVRRQVLDIDARVRVLDTDVQVNGLDMVVQVIFAGR